MYRSIVIQMIRINNICVRLNFIIVNNFEQSSRRHTLRNKRSQKFAQKTNNVTSIESYRPQVTRKTRVEIIPRSLNQEQYLSLLMNEKKSIIIASGPAGSGKSLMAMLTSIKALKERQISKIILTRPAVAVEDEKHGYLPGTLNDKMAPWTRPLFDILHEYYSPQEVIGMLQDEVLEICPLAFMRGRTFKNCHVIADEMQNGTPAQFKMLLTRIGENSRIFVTGDTQQADRKIGENGLLDFNKLLADFGDSKYVGTIQFNKKDIVRHPAVEEILRIYKE